MTKLCNTPHPWAPYQVVAIGNPSKLLWTIQSVQGTLSIMRFKRADEAERHALRMARFDNDLTAVERRVFGGAC